MTWAGRHHRNRQFNRSPQMYQKQSSWRSTDSDQYHYGGEGSTKQSQQGKQVKQQVKQVKQQDQQVKQSKDKGFFARLFGMA